MKKLFVGCFSASNTVVASLFTTNRVLQMIEIQDGGGGGGLDEERFLEVFGCCPNSVLSALRGLMSTIHSVRLVFNQFSSPPHTSHLVLNIQNGGNLG